MLIQPDWPAPPGVHGVTTTRRGGVSEGAFSSLNMSLAAGDTEAAVVENRRRVAEAAQCPQDPCWLGQMHGTRVIEMDRQPASPPPADGAFTTDAGRVCAVLSADCLPILLSAEDGAWVAALHAGWRGLARGIIEVGVSRYPQTPRRLLAWLGPAISQEAFEVGPEVKAQFVENSAACADCFRPSPARAGHYLADLYALARVHLARAGVDRIWGGDFCTHADSERFFSYRRDGVTGRMATLIWRAA